MIIALIGFEDFRNVFRIFMHTLLTKDLCTVTISQSLSEEHVRISNNLCMQSLIPAIEITLKEAGELNG